MYEKHYLEYYDDTGQAELVNSAKQSGLSPREFAERVYLPMLLVDDVELLSKALSAQASGFVYDVFRRVWELYGEEFDFWLDQFQTEKYSSEPDIQMQVMHLPKTGHLPGNFLLTVLVLDMKNVEVYYLAVERSEDGGRLLTQLDPKTCRWKHRGTAPYKTKEVLQRMLELTVGQGAPDYHYIEKSCPLCGRTCRLGLTDTEFRGYKNVCENNGDLQESLPGLKAFELEFLITGMCPHCQCAVFNRTLPEDLSRWQAD